MRAALSAINPVAPILDVAAGELDADAFIKAARMRATESSVELLSTTRMRRLG